MTQNLVEGLSPASLSEFYDQRMRWTAGGLQQLFYQGVVLRRVPIKPIWGAEWDEQIKRGVPGMSRSARFAWLPLTVYYVIPISVVLYCYLAMLCQIVIDWRCGYDSIFHSETQMTCADFPLLRDPCFPNGAEYSVLSLPAAGTTTWFRFTSASL